MRVIVCGAGQVGSSIASYLSRENNDVTVIDTDSDRIADVNAHADVNSIVGSASNPDVLNNAGANDADMIIAVTNSDEVNMVSCQIAHSLFNVPKKVARLRQPELRNSRWANLFSRAHMPIDVIVSPEAEVAKAVSMRLAVPGTTSVVSLANKKAYLCGVICEENCPLINTPLRQLRTLFPDIKAKILTIMRHGQAFVPGPDDQMLMWDEVFFLVEASQVERALSAFGHEEKKARNVVIVGGGNIGHALLEEITTNQKDVNLKIIEQNSEKTYELSEAYEDVIVLEADSLDRQVMEEVNISQVETLIAVTNNDETNILTSMMALQEGCERVIPLVNKTIYNSVTGSLGLGSIISPRAITVSSIMRHIRRGRVKAVHDVASNFAELLEISVSESCSVLNQPIQEAGFPDGVVVAALIRGEEIIVPNGDAIMRADDLAIILAPTEHVSSVEKMFSAQVDLF